MNFNENCISHWFPLLARTGVAVPRTVILKAEHALYKIIPDYGEKLDTEAHKKFLDQIRGTAMSAVGGAPFFLRTGQTSGKHFWKETCHVTDMTKLGAHVYALIEFSECAGFIGLPYNVWAVREMLNTKPAFVAFDGLPITKERRYFFGDGKILGHHPYWPPEAFKEQNMDSSKHMALEALNAVSDEEHKELSELTLQVAKNFTDSWSLDWLHTDRGWIAIDMARAEDSYVWKDHPTAPKFKDPE